MTSILYDQSGHVVTIGQKIGAGGEGAVFEIVGSGDYVAKIYYKDLSPSKALKLTSMPGLGKKEILAVAAWPTATLHGSRGGQVSGLIMPRIKGFEEIHTLYSPAHRKTTFPNADWKFLVGAASNCAAAFHAFHEAKIVIGDVNQSNVLVSETAKVALIDCDSYQIQNGTQIFPCEVGVPLFTPPELQGQSFHGRTRTTNHDLFGLAVLIFHLLFMGKHPFSVRFSGKGEMPLERSIREFRFPYGKEAARKQVKPPVHSLPLEVLSPQLVSLFERAFAQGAQTSGSRPTAADWFSALRSFISILRPCTQDPGHLIPAHRSTCPWHDLMKQGSPNFFISVSLSRIATISAFDLAKVWARIDKIPRLQKDYSRPALPQGKSPLPWPQNLPSIFPLKPTNPKILANPPTPPPPKLPPQKHAKTVLSVEGKQKKIKFLAISFFAAFITSFLMGGYIGSTIFGDFLVVSILFSLLPFAGFVGSSAGWAMMEFLRKKGETALNVDYYLEKKQRKKEAMAQTKAWNYKLSILQDEAKRQYKEDCRKWQIVVEAGTAEGLRRKNRPKEFLATIQNSEQRWLLAVNQITEEFDRKKIELQKLKERHNQITAENAADYQRLLGRAREMQMDAFLDQYCISDHDIPGFGASRKATLESNGIETARDIEFQKVMGVPGFKEKLTGQLLQWRAGIEAKFKFNAALGIPKNEQQALAVKYFQLRQPIEEKILEGEKVLNEINQRGRSGPTIIFKEILEKMDLYAQAILNVAVIPKGF